MILELLLGYMTHWNIIEISYQHTIIIESCLSVLCTDKEKKVAHLTIIAGVAASKTWLTAQSRVCFQPDLTGSDCLAESTCCVTCYLTGNTLKGTSAHRITVLLGSGRVERFWKRDQSRNTNVHHLEARSHQPSPPPPLHHDVILPLLTRHTLTRQKTLMLRLFTVSLGPKNSLKVLSDRVSVSGRRKRQTLLLMML